MSINQQHPYIAQHIAEAMQHLGGLSDEILEKMEDTAAHISEQLVAGHKLLVLGTPGIAPLGDLLCYNLLHRYPDQRPALPAIALSGIIAYDESTTDREPVANRQKADFRPFFRAVEAIANSGDTLIVLADQRLPGILGALEQLYVGRGVTSVMIAPDSTEFANRSNSHTIQLSLECDTIAGIHETTLFILNTLGDMIESSVFGGYQPPE